MSKKIWIQALSLIIVSTLSGCLRQQGDLGRSMLDSPLYREMLGDEAVDKALEDYDKEMESLEEEVREHRSDIVEELSEELLKGVRGLTSEGDTQDSENAERVKSAESLTRVLGETFIDALFGTEQNKIDYSDWEYKPGDFFTDDYEPCKVHYKKSPCKDYYMDGDVRIELGARQCFGYARYAQYKMYGETSYGKTSSHFSHTRGVSHGKLTADTLKELVEEAGPGAHIRTGNTASGSEPNNHSMIITEITEDGFTVIQCNGHGNKEYSDTEPKSQRNCRVGTTTYTWESYVNDSYGQRGLDYIEYYNQ